MIFFNESNTEPGPFSFYLWEPTGVTFPELVHRMIEVALRRHYDAGRRITSYDVNLLSAADLKGIKTGK